MPYSKPGDPALPDHVKGQPEDVQRQWIAVFNSVIERGGDEAEAMRQANGVLKERKKMAEIVLFPIMELDTSKYGKVDFGEEFAAKVLAHFEQRVLKIDPAVDVGHDGGKAQGWIKRLFKASFKNAAGKDIPAIKAEVEWTPEGKAAIKDRHFRYFSPEIGSYKDEETGKTYYPVLFGGALTNTPVLKLMPEVSLSDCGKIVLSEKTNDPPPPIEIELEDIPATNFEEAPTEGALLHPLLTEFDALLAKGEDFWRGITGAPTLRTYLKEVRARLANMNLRSVQTPGGPGEAGDVNEPKKRRMNMSEIHKLLQLSETATDEEVQAKLTEMIGEKTALSEKVTELEAAKAADEKDLAELSKQMTETGQRIVFAEGLAVITKACEEGRMLPAQRDLWGRRYMSDPIGTRELIESLGKVIEFGEAGSAGSGEAEPITLESESKKLAEEKGIPLDEAIRLVMAEKPELGEAHLKKVGG